MARKYQEHVIDQAATILRHRKITNMFTTPRLLENLAERMSLVKAGLKGVFVGGTTMTPQYVRFVVEEVLENKINFAPTYGNTLMGLAISKKLTKAEDNYSLTYYAPQPRATLRIVNPDNPSELMPYNEYGRVELTTMTKEFFVPRFLERDEAIRRPPATNSPGTASATSAPSSPSPRPSSKACTEVGTALRAVRLTSSVTRSFRSLSSPPASVPHTPRLGPRHHTSAPHVLSRPTHPSAPTGPNSIA
jgi:hypothetical protein